MLPLPFSYVSCWYGAVISCIGLVMSCYVIILSSTINVCSCKCMVSQSISRKSVIFS